MAEARSAGSAVLTQYTEAPAAKAASIWPGSFSVESTTEWIAGLLDTARLSTPSPLPTSSIESYSVMKTVGCDSSIISSASDGDVVLPRTVTPTRLRRPSSASSQSGCRSRITAVFSPYPLIERAAFRVDYTFEGAAPWLYRTQTFV